VRVEFAILFLVLSVTPAFGQKLLDIEKEYGPPTQVYSLSEHIWMSPEYGIDGEICRIRLYPKADFSKHRLSLEGTTFSGIN